MTYDALVVGAGLYGAVFARQLTDHGKRVLVIEKRDHVGGNCHTEIEDGIVIHRHGPHVFHTSNEEVWAYANRFARFYNHRTKVVANNGGKIYSFPINMLTFHQVYGVTTPDEAKAIVAKDKPDRIDSMRDYCISKMGRRMYEVMVEGYTTKQWGRPPEELPASIGARIPVRFTYDDKRFDDKFEGLPEGGYTPMVERMLEGIEVRLGLDYFWDKKYCDGWANRTVYTGPIDALFGYDAGKLEYRSLIFSVDKLGVDQGIEAINYTDGLGCTRVIQYNYFMEKPVDNNHTQVYEYPSSTGEPCYPVNDDKNNKLAAEYIQRAEAMGYIVGGRLARYAYADMDDTIAAALTASNKLLLT